MRFLIWILGLQVMLATPVSALEETGATATPSALTQRIDQGLIKASQYLLGRQSQDGAWRSEAYGAFRSGLELTPLVMHTIYYMPQNVPAARAAWQKGLVYLASFVDSEGRLREPPGGLTYPVYTASLAVRAFAYAPADRPFLTRSRAAWLRYLMSYRLGSDLGWSPSDTEAGGWGYALRPPRKPEQAEFRQPFNDSNLSATVYAIGALGRGGIPIEAAGDQALAAEILGFVIRCQNFPDDPEKADSRFDDGGFFMCPTNPVQNKAGSSGVDATGRARYRSYGSTTADGLRALMRLGLPRSHPRVHAAQTWLERRFTVKTNPGDFAEMNEELRDAVYYYYVWSLSHALMHLGGRTVNTPGGPVDWAQTLADELLHRQNENGSWTNRFTAAQEDDPLVATPFAAAALILCRYAR